MIVVQVVDPTLRRAALRACSREEDVVTGPLTYEAIEFGFPRLVIREHGGGWHPPSPKVRVVDIEPSTLRAWEASRRAMDLPPTRLEHLSGQLSQLIEQRAERRTAVGRALADVSRAAGGRLPLPLTGFARRVMEFPWHYRSLHPVAEVCGSSRGALKARFRRRGLATPTTYLRWFRVLAVASLMSDRTVTVAAAARRLGFTSDGNLCRMLWSVSSMTPTEVRTLTGWRRLLITFTWQHLSADDREAWSTLDDLFRSRAA